MGGGAGRLGSPPNAPYCTRSDLRSTRSESPSISALRMRTSVSSPPATRARVSRERGVPVRQGFRAAFFMTVLLLFTTTLAREWVEGKLQTSLDDSLHLGPAEPRKAQNPGRWPRPLLLPVEVRLALLSAPSTAPRRADQLDLVHPDLEPIERRIAVVGEELVGGERPGDQDLRPLPDVPLRKLHPVAEDHAGDPVGPDLLGAVRLPPRRSDRDLEEGARPRVVNPGVRPDKAETGILAEHRPSSFDRKPRSNGTKNLFRF